MRAPDAIRVLGAAFALATAAVQADDTGSTLPARPKWEVGIASVAVTVADYPASDEYRTRLLPLPYFVYRGQTLRADQQGSRLRRKLTPNLEIDISGGGAFAVDSGGSDAREGMPDLGYLLELGPNLRLIWPGPAAGGFTLVNLPVRGVLSIGDPGLNWRGAVFAPELAYVQPRLLGDTTVARISLASTFASLALQDYFYTVDPRYATAARPAYEASAGYLGSSLGVRTVHVLGRHLRGFVSLRYYRYAGAANTDSPLFRDAGGYTAAVGLSWSFAQSREPAADD